MELIREFWDWLWAFVGVEDNRDRLSSISTIITTILAIIAPILGGAWWILRRSGKKTDKGPDKIAPVPAKPMLSMTLDQFEERQRRLRDEITENLQSAHAEDRTQLQARLDAVNARLADPDTALAAAQATIADLKERLAREGNSVGGDKLAEAQAALAAGDTSLADDLFAEIEARHQIEVQSAARAAFARGEIAEADVRWADAAGHYARAARLQPGFQSLYKASHLSWQSGDYGKALKLGDDMLAHARREDSQENLSLALDGYAKYLQSSRQYDAAEPLFREALEIDRITVGEEHPEYASGLNNLAALLQDTRCYDEAERLYRQALEIDEATLRTAHPDYATRLNNLAGLLEDTRRYDEAEPLFRLALEIDEATLGTAHPDYATHLNNLAVLYFHMERYVEAVPLMEQALSIREATLGAEHQHTVGSRASLADIRAALEAAE